MSLKIGDVATRTVVVIALSLSTAIACSKKTATAPTPTVTSTAVTFPAGGTIFIGSESQFQVQETLSDGTTRQSTTGIWGSDALSVATVSQAGLVSAVGAGEATIFVDGGARGTLRIRVYPNFTGTWIGEERLSGCVDSGVFAGICEEFAGVGQVFRHLTTLSQTGAAVNAVLYNGATATATGTIAIDGELQLLPAPYLPAEPELTITATNWRSRADVPSQMTGTYDGVFTSPGRTGTMTWTFQLQNVSTAGAAASLLSPSSGSALEQARRQVADYLRRRR